MNDAKNNLRGILMIFMILVVATGFAFAQTQAERDVRRLERAWLDAYETRDSKAMDEIVGDEFVITFPDGTKQTKPQLMEQLKKLPRIPNTSLKYRTDNVKAEVVADRVVLTGRVITERILNGQTMSSEESLYTDTYIKRNGRWQVVESHLTKPKAAQSVLTPEIKQQTVNDLAALLPERYAFRDIGQKLQQLLQQNLKAGKYDSYGSPLEFSIAVTNDLRSLQSDRHLALNYSPETPVTNPVPSSTPTPVTREELARRASVFNRQMNFGFKNVQFLYGNIGYLKFDYFDSFLDYSRPVADASMAFFKNSDALIIDLRENGGGSGEMVNYLAGFFLSERVHSGTSYNRLTDSTTEEYIDPQQKDKQLGDIDLYILTSKNTVSAAEALAYHLKYLRKGIVIGEISAGAANPGRVTRLNSMFTAFIPNRHGMHIVTKTNWEGTGVPVDIASAAEDALRLAKLEALKKLRRKATDPDQQRKFTNYITYLEKTYPEKELREKEMRSYVGEYQGGRSVVLKEGKLFYNRAGDASGQMRYISPDLFMLAEGDTVITFKRDKQNKVTELASQWTLSGPPARAEKTK